MVWWKNPLETTFPQRKKINKKKRIILSSFHNFTDTSTSCPNDREDKNEALAAKKSVLLSSFYFAPIGYYATLFRSDEAIIETHDHYQRQSYRNRCLIGGANGTIALNIPIEKPRADTRVMKDVRIANHGNWRHVHWHAILSAYNMTPYFEYYKDDFIPFFEKRYHFLHDFNEAIRQKICELIAIQTPVSSTAHYIKNLSTDTIDCREAFHPKRQLNKEMAWQPREYHQVFLHKHGFIPNLSIIDLLFNMGNESRLYL